MKINKVGVSRNGGKLVMMKGCSCILGAGLILMSASLFAATSVDQLAQLVEQKSYSQAWQQAQQLTKAHEGDPRFDYLYGLSALESGHFDQAVFALDRVVVQQPYAVRPRLELARAYMKVNNREAALREFNEVLKLNPPSAVRENVNRFVTVLSTKNKSIPKWALDSRFTAGVGYDSNANFGADSTLFETPVFGTVTLNELSVKQSSSFAFLQGQFNYRYVSSNKLTWFADANLGQKQYREAGEFDLRQLGVGGGALMTSGKQQYRVALSSRALWLDGDDYKTAATIEAGVAHDLNDGGVLSSTFAFDKYNYQDQGVRDGQGVAWSGAYSFEKNNTRHHFNSFVKREQADQNEGMHHARNILGAGYTVARAWDNGHVSSATVDYQSLQHRGNDPVYAKKRRDKRLGLRLGHSVKLSKQASFFVTAGLIKNSSNLQLYDTDKNYVQTGINYRF